MRLFLLLIFVTLNAIADNVPPVTITSTPIVVVTMSPSTKTSFAGIGPIEIIDGNYQPACDAYVASYPFVSNDGLYTYYALDSNSCDSDGVTVFERMVKNSTGETWKEYEGRVGWQKELKCNQGVFSGSSCVVNTCPTGYFFESGSGTCKSITDGKCTIPSEGIVTSGYYTTTVSGRVQNVACISSCTSVFSSTRTCPSNVYLDKGNTSYACHGYYQSTGEYCDTPTNLVFSDSAPVSTCPTGQTVGHINARPICYTSDPQPSEYQEKEITSTERVTEQLEDGSTKVTETTQNPDGSTTTITNVYNSGTQPGTTPDSSVTETTFNPDTKDIFCSNNPSSSLCKEQIDQCKKNPSSLACTNLGEIPEIDLPTQTTSFTVDKLDLDFGHVASCPSAIPLSITDDLSFDLTNVCTAFSSFKPILLGLAWLVSGFIVAGGFRS